MSGKNQFKRGRETLHPEKGRSVDRKIPQISAESV
jgi:hypothetical protein